MESKSQLLDVVRGSSVHAKSGSPVHAKRGSFVHTKHVDIMFMHGAL